MIQTIFIAIIKHGIKLGKIVFLTPVTPQDPIAIFQRVTAVEDLKLVYMHKSRDHTMYIV